METGGAALGVVFARQEFEAVSTVDMTVTGTQTIAEQIVESLSVNGDASIGNASTDTIGFYGHAGGTQPTAVTSVTTTAATSTTNAFGYVTQAQADGLVTAVNALITRFQGLGLLA